MARIIALTTPGALGLSGAPVHEPVHAWRQQYPMTVTQRDTIDMTYLHARERISPS